MNHPPGCSSSLPVGAHSSANQSNPTQKKSDQLEKPKRKGGQGRNGRDDFPGAEKICVNHRDLKPGDTCPHCGSGTLVEARPKSVLQFLGQSPIKLNIYLLQRLVCSLCESIFNSTIPGEPEAPLDPTGDEEIKQKERVYDPTVAASIVCQRFEAGVPHYRLAEILNAEGLPFPASTQVKIMENLRDPGQSIFKQLEKTGAQADLIYIDDTHKRILEMERSKDAEDLSHNDNKNALLRPKSYKNKKKSSIKKKGTATAIVAETDRGKISLFYTGSRVAGMNLAELLKYREERLGPVNIMCDGLAANKPVGYTVTIYNCLDHARRKFYDLIHLDEIFANKILDHFEVIYKNEKTVKEKKLSPEQRLTFHKENSQKSMDSIFDHVDQILAGKHSEPNGFLVSAAEYVFKRKTELSQFLRIPGAPLSNSEAERLIKTYIRHRKNSLQFYSLKGAQFGSQMMSIIQTCKNFGVSAFKYLTIIGKYSVKVQENPALWMPWNFQDAIPNSS
jgi:transposase